MPTVPIQLQQFMTVSPEGMMVINEEGTVICCNQATLRLLGFSGTETLSQKSGTPYFQSILSRFPKVTDEPCPQKTAAFYRDNGEEFTAEYSIFLIQENPALYGVIFRDVTDRMIKQTTLEILNENLELEFNQRTEELQDLNQKLEHELRERKILETQLIQAQKMESLGQLAAGVAHEINNPVGFVMSNLGTLNEYAELFQKLFTQYYQLKQHLHTLTDGIAQTHPLWQTLRTIEQLEQQEDLNFVLEDIGDLLSESQEGTRRVKEIVQNLKSFARVDEAQVKEANINECIETTLKMVWNEVKYKCNVEKKLGDIPNIYCYPGQLNQVFINLLVNAAQAMTQFGTIRIETRLEHNHLVITVKDNGSGIAPEHLENIFNPFFTTKPVGKGTGLGLSVSYGIIQSHGGTITVDSTVGQGTQFTIQLPITNDLAALAEPEEPLTAPPLMV